MTVSDAAFRKYRREFVGGSDARIIMGDDEAGPLGPRRVPLSRSRSGPLPQPYARTPAILVDELDAGCFQRPAHSQIVRNRHRCFTFGEFGTTNCGNPNLGFAGEILCAPPESKALRAYQRPRKF